MAKSKRGIIVAVLAALVLAGGAGFLVVKNTYEKKQAAEIAALVASVPAPYTLTVGAVDVSFFSRGVTLGNVVFSIPLSGGALTVTADSIELSGGNLKAFAKDAGVVTLANTMKLRNVVTSAPTFNGTVALYEFSDIKGDFSWIVREWVKAVPVLLELQQQLELATDSLDTTLPPTVAGDQTGVETQGIISSETPKKELAEILADLNKVSDLIKALETMHIGKMTFTGYAANTKLGDKTLGMTMTGGEVQDYSLSAAGLMKINTLAVTIDEKTVGTLAEIGAKGFRSPGYAKLFTMLLNEPDEEDFKEYFRGQEIALNDFYFKNLRAGKNAENPEVLVAGMNFTFSMQPGKDGRFALNLNDLSFNKSHIEDKLMERDVPVELLPEQLVMSFKLDVQVVEKGDDRFDLVINPAELDVKGMGMVSLSSDMRNIATRGINPDARIATVGLRVQDSGLSTIMFTHLGRMRAMDGGELRKQTVSMLEMQAKQIPLPALVKAQADLIGFIRDAGSTYTLNLAPANPVTLNELSQAIMVSPESIGLSTTLSK